MFDVIQSRCQDPGRCSGCLGGGFPTPRQSSSSSLAPPSARGWCESTDGEGQEWVFPPPQWVLVGDGSMFYIFVNPDRRSYFISIAHRFVFLAERDCF